MVPHLSHLISSFVHRIGSLSLSISSLSSYRLLNVIWISPFRWRRDNRHLPVCCVPCLILVYAQRILPPARVLSALPLHALLPRFCLYLANINTYLAVPFLYSRPVLSVILLPVWFTFFAPVCTCRLTHRGVILRGLRATLLRTFITVYDTA